MLTVVLQDGPRDDQRLRGAQGAHVPLGAAALRGDQGLHLRADALLLLQLRVHPRVLGAGVMQVRCQRLRTPAPAHRAQ